jgi:hypothetical protein
MGHNVLCLEGRFLANETNEHSGSFASPSTGSLNGERSILVTDTCGPQTSNDFERQLLAAESGRSHATAFLYRHRTSGNGLDILIGRISDRGTAPTGKKVVQLEVVQD